MLQKTDGPDTMSFDTEREMLEAFQKYIMKRILISFTGWNIFGFDLEYIYNEPFSLGVSQNFSKWEN
jgi:DNA polymerase delta subunit 1